MHKVGNLIIKNSIKVKINKMHSQNKQNNYTHVQKPRPIPQHKERNNKIKGDIHRSANQLMLVKNKISKCGDHRFSEVQVLSEKNVRLDQLTPSYNRGAREREALSHLRNSENFHVFSTIDMLKKQAQLLDLQENLGTIHKFSTLEHIERTLPKSICLQVTKFRKQNARKIARGRPQLYNWVRNHKQEIANLQPDYKTQVLKKCSRAALYKDQEQKLEKTDKQTQTIRSREHQSCNKSKRLTFVQRLRRLEDLKQRGQVNQLAHKRRVHSQSQQQRHQICNLKTLW